MIFRASTWMRPRRALWYEVEGMVNMEDVREFPEWIRA